MRDLLWNGQFAISFIQRHDRVNITLDRGVTEFQ